MIRFRLGINSILYLLLSTTLAVAIALGGCKPQAAIENKSEAVEMEDLLDESLSLSSDYIRDKPEVETKTFEPSAGALPPDPDNAALLYYQAFLLRPEPDDATEDLLYGVLRGAKPDEKIREYLEDCRETIEYTEAAAQIPQCNWGLWYSRGYGPSSKLRTGWRSLAFLLGANTRVLAAEGDYRAALGRCLTILRLGGHIGGETGFSYSGSVGVDVIAVGGIQHILGCMPPDPDTLRWLKDRLAITRAAPQLVARALEMDFELMLQAMRTNGKTLPRLREKLAENADDASAKKEIRSLTDEQLLVRAREPYAKFLNSVLRAMDSEMSYEETHAEIQKLTEELLEQTKSNPAVILSMRISAEQVVKFYALQVRHTAHINALKAAIEVYLTTAKTGQLPEALPDHLPKDPFSGEDFEYETTEEGFVLRHQRGRDIPGGGLRPLEFKLQK